MEFFPNLNPRVSSGPLFNAGFMGISVPGNIRNMLNGN